jgi:hypothetical protein
MRESLPASSPALALRASAVQVSTPLRSAQDACSLLTSSCPETQRERLLAQHPVGHAANLPGAAHGARSAAFRQKLTSGRVE